MSYHGSIRLPLFFLLSVLLSLLWIGPLQADDRITNERVSVSSRGAEGDYVSFDGRISADGARVAFQSGASNLVPGDGNSADDVFLRDRRSGTTTLMCVSSMRVQGNAGCVDPAISGNGRFVAFASGSDNLVPGDTNGESDIFVRDVTTGQTTRVSVGPGGVQATGFGGSSNPVLSFDGRFVAYESYMDNLVGDGIGGSDVITDDGKEVVFASDADNLISRDTNGWPDVFVAERK